MYIVSLSMFKKSAKIREVTVSLRYSTELPVDRQRGECLMLVTGQPSGLTSNLTAYETKNYLISGEKSVWLARIGRIEPAKRVRSELIECGQEAAKSEKSNTSQKNTDW